MFQVASFYDQNHESNHKNAMVGQSVIIDCAQGDKVQIYLFTDTGLQVRRGLSITEPIEKISVFPYSRTSGTTT